MTEKIFETTCKACNPPSEKLRVWKDSGDSYLVWAEDAVRWIEIYLDKNDIIRLSEALVAALRGEER